MCSSKHANPVVISRWPACSLTLTYFILESVLFDVPRAVYRLLSLNTN